MMELIHMTASYSNAVLVAILPQISEFAKKVDLPIPQPITTSQVLEFRPSPLKDFIGGGLMLTNGCWFCYEFGGVSSFRSPDNVFYDDDPAANWPKYAFGKDNMTTNEAIALARNMLRKLGYSPELLHVDIPPLFFRGPEDAKDGHHLPHCQMRWERYPEVKTEEQRTNNDYVTFEINMEKKTVTGLHIVSGKTHKAPPQVDVVPELESEYRKRISGTMFIRSNAPPKIQKK